jgi:sugar fermentation stimulation protein A
MPQNFRLPFSDSMLTTASFLSRPNRFLVTCEHERFGIIRAFMANPGRLSELLFPGTKLYILDHSDDAGDRVTRFTVVAIERDGAPVMLHTHWCNDMVQALLNHGAIPGLETTRIMRREVTVGHSRFDFLLEDHRGEIYVEVKSCTLFGNGVAMFPDAVTERGRRHLVELAELSSNGKRCCVLFIVQTNKVACFMPDYHTDLAFAQTMLAVRDKVQFKALPVSWTRKLRFKPGTELLPIPWQRIVLEAQDRGAYILLLYLDGQKIISTGGLGAITFEPGYYLYIGSAMGGLNVRMARHQRKRKRMHWHIDYLRDAAVVLDLFPIRSSRRMECDIADYFDNILEQSVQDFGCSDCGCNSHLFFTPDNPLEQHWFHDGLQQWRMNPRDGH